MSAFVRIAALAGLALSLACQDGAQPRQTDGEATNIQEAQTLAHLGYSGYTQSARDVITNERDWVGAWARLYQSYEPKPDLPAVDFGSERVLLAALGNRNTGGYSILIDRLAVSDNGTTVFVTTVAPGGGCITTGALTQPVHAVRVPTPPEPVTFEQRSVTRDCQ